MKALTWRQKLPQELSRWQHRKWVQHLRQQNPKLQNWDAFSDAESYDKQVKSLGLPTEFNTLQAGMFEVRIAIIAGEVSKIRSLLHHTAATSSVVAFVETDIVTGEANPDMHIERWHTTRGADRLMSLLEEWAAAITNEAQELEILLSSLAKDEVEEFFIGSEMSSGSEVSSVDTGGTRPQSADKHVLEPGDVVRLEEDFETHSGRILRRGARGRICDVHRADELPMFVVEFADTFDYVGVPEHHLGLLEKAEWPAGLLLVGDGHDDP